MTITALALRPVLAHGGVEAALLLVVLPLALVVGWEWWSRRSGS